MRKICIIKAGIFLTLLFTSCKQFTADIDDYLSYWSSEAYVKEHTVKAVHQNDRDRFLCIPSTDDVEIMLTMHNPKNFLLVMPTTPADAEKVIRFPELSTQPVHGDANDYTLKQTASGLVLKYTKKFLQEHEWGNGDMAGNYLKSPGRQRI